MRAFAIVSVVGLLIAPLAPAQSTGLVGGTGTIYVGAFPDRIYAIDEATDQVDTITTTLPGPPNEMRLSADDTRIYARDRSFEQIEIIDLATRQTIDTLTLSEGSMHVRIRNYVVSPDDRYLILLADTATKLVDRFDIAPRRLLQVDLNTHEIMQEIPWPGGHERVRANMRFSPRGDLLYLFGPEIIALETENFSEVERWNLTELGGEGLGTFNFGFRRDPNEEPGFASGLFRVDDPVQNRRLMGIARINLAERDVDFYTLGPEAPLSSFALAPGREKAYAILSRIGHYEFWTFDLAGRRVENRRVIDGRPRMAVLPSTNGQLLYIHQAGETIDVYKADDYQYLRTISLDGDMTNVLIVP